MPEIKANVQQQSESQIEMWLKAVPGVIFLFAISIFAKGAKDFGFAQWPGLEGLIKTHWEFGSVYLSLNYVVIVLLIGIIIRNTIGIPSWAALGVKTSRLFIKMGVILLGTLYSLAELAKLGTVSFSLILVFVFGTVLFGRWLGNKMGLEPGASSVLAAGVGVCGVSAIVATAPSVKAKSQDIAMAIATILTFGLICLFAFPIIGKLIGLSSSQFGAWAGTGILNSGQVLAAALAFDPGTVARPSESLKVGEVFNLTRVIFLPAIVMVLAIWYSKGEAGTGEVKTGGVGSLWSKFPIFVLGFLATVILTSTGVFGSIHPSADPTPELVAFRKLYAWFFAIGLTGLGLQISFDEMKKAGGKPLFIGCLVGTIKAVGALIVVMLFVD
jgi:uncharacterized integral membrane protein (TIGR00698 family)